MYDASVIAAALCVHEVPCFHGGQIEAASSSTADTLLWGRDDRLKSPACLTGYLGTSHVGSPTQLRPRGRRGSSPDINRPVRVIGGGSTWLQPHCLAYLASDGG